MFTTINDFIYIWSQEFESTQKVLKHVTNGSLSREVSPGGRTLGRIAWHIVTTIPEMLNRTGLSIPGPEHNSAPPASAKEIFDAYNKAAEALLNQVKGKWNDASLQIEDEMYGAKWKRSVTLASLVFHQIHHRAQMTVLMRQAGLSVPGIYGPSREEWGAMNMAPLD